MTRKDSRRDFKSNNPDKHACTTYDPDYSKRFDDSIHYVVIDDQPQDGFYSRIIKQAKKTLATWSVIHDPNFEKLFEINCDDIISTEFSHGCLVGREVPGSLVQASFFKNQSSTRDALFDLVSSAYVEYSSSSEYDDDYHDSQKPGISFPSIHGLGVLLPLIIDENPNIYFNSSNGLLNIELDSLGDTKLVIEVQDTSVLRYSLISSRKKLVTISGVAKFRAPEDLIEFSRVLRML